MKTMTKRALGLAGAALLLLILVLLGKTLAFRSRQIVVDADAAAALAIDEAALIRRLSLSIQFRTVSHQDEREMDAAQFVALRAFLRQAFPRVHEILGWEEVAKHSLLYSWAGLDPSLRPLVLMGHMDVVPVAADSVERWTEPPFSGRIRDGYVWGRGSLDDKVGVMSILEAVELLLESGYRPQRTIHLAFGHDEEAQGLGAGAIAELLRSRGARPDLVLDEGLVITEGLMPGVAAPIAAIGTAQKGYLTIELSVTTEGGHSSMPPPHTAVGILSAAIARLEEHQLPASISSVTRQMFEHVGPEMSFPLRLVFANLWLTSPLVSHILLGKPATAALIRTTTAATMFTGSPKENILPTTARAVINFRIRPGESVASVISHVNRTVADGRVVLRPLSPGREPSEPSSPDTPHFALVARSLREVDPGLIVAPSLMIGYADAYHYEKMSPNVYRFRAIKLGPADLSRLHGIDERIAIPDYLRCVRFNVQLLRNATR